MSIEIKNVTKEYGLQKALNNVSFTVNQGEILGFLGPNGAGKSTLMKIVTCFIPPTEGTVIVDGYDVREDSLEIRKRVGYLPEHNPLYLDMYVKEYLTFIAGVHKLSKKKEKVSNVVELVGLGLEQNKKIGQLSKGYKQRVGLAQALIHDPKVLILDEPTSGLDPNQLADIREVIKKIGKEKTVMFSSHIMQEIEAICDRIVIINRGNLVVDKDAIQMMNTSANRQIVRVEFDKVVSKTMIKSIPSVDKVKQI
ncbi:MAG: ATP-binding cassette domain-containing protein, partial [Flavobacteriales bacterium]